MSSSTIYVSVADVRADVELLITNAPSAEGTSGDRQAEQPGLAEALDKLVHPSTGGTLMLSLRWIRTSTYELAADLQANGNRATAERPPPGTRICARWRASCRMAIYNHTGLVVTDLERSKRFFQEVLGFRFWYEIKPPDKVTAKLNCLEPPLGMTATYLVLDGFVLELLHFGATDATAAVRRRTMNEPGLTHLSISVDDIHATAEKAVAYGAELIEESDIDVALFIRDPDGQLIELLPSTYRDRLPPHPAS